MLCHPRSPDRILSLLGERALPFAEPLPNLVETRGPLADNGRAQTPDVLALKSHGCLKAPRESAGA